MVETVYDANGVGLAAPQIGVSLRLFLALEIGPTDEDETLDPDSLTESEKRQLWGVLTEHVLVNPQIVSLSGTQIGQDGCLSVPGLFIETMERADLITVKYQNLKGTTQTLKASGRLAHIIQHENDHLDGILFFDRLRPAERREFKETHRAELAEIQRDSKLLVKSLNTASDQLLQG
jgi:peptide deformylase